MAPSVIIVGSGLVGAATAIALHQAGIPCALYDQIEPMEVVMRGEAIEFGETGGSVLIHAGGLRVLKTLGLLDECIAAGTTSPYVSWHKIDGSAPIVSDTRIANRTAGETDPKLLSPLQILRSRLHSIFIKACHKVGIKTHIGKKLATIEQGEGSVTATFVDGTTATGDLLIGADGMHSATRRRVFGENLTATFTGSMGHIGVVNIKEHQINLKETEECAFYVDRDRKLFAAVFKASEDIAAVQVSTFGDNEEQDKSASYRPYTDLPKHAGRLADLLHEWGVAPHVEKMMRCAFRVSAASIYDLPDMETYHKGRVLLVGDAAHGMVPNAGIGLLTGLEDVGTLLALFKRYPQGQDWDKVLALYSKIRVPRGTGAANQARNIRTKTVATTPIFGGNLNHFVFRLVIHAANAGMFSLYSLFDCEVEVAKAIEDAK
ncbi:hypothetical protein HDU79_008251 [Rhizoclosmatium sp. JEL0117]|nr:hypothetical protein HDU79_008251 [Rhizoclosmatium sp. JEL0117]